MSSWNLHEILDVTTPPSGRLVPHPMTFSTFRDSVRVRGGSYRLSGAGRPATAIAVRKSGKTASGYEYPLMSPLQVWVVRLQ